MTESFSNFEVDLERELGDLEWAEQHIFDGADEMFREIDEDGSGEVAQDEAIVWLGQFEYFDEEALEIFHRIDKNGDGAWTLGEFREGYRDFISRLSIQSAILTKRKHDDILTQLGFPPEQVELYTHAMIDEVAGEDAGAAAKETYHEVIDEILGPQTVRAIEVCFYMMWEEWTAGEVEAVLRATLLDFHAEEQRRIMEGLAKRGITGDMVDAAAESLLLAVAGEEVRDIAERRGREEMAARTLARMVMAVHPRRAWRAELKKIIQKKLQGQREEVQAMEYTLRDFTEEVAAEVAGEVLRELMRVQALECAAWAVEEILEGTREQVKVDAKASAKYAVYEIVKGGLNEAWHRQVEREEAAALAEEASLDAVVWERRGVREAKELRELPITLITKTPDDWTPPPRSPKWPKRKVMTVPPPAPKDGEEGGQGPPSPTMSRAETPPPSPPNAHGGKRGGGTEGLATVGGTWGGGVRGMLSDFAGGVGWGGKDGGEEEWYGRERALLEGHCENPEGVHTRSSTLKSSTWSTANTLPANGHPTSQQTQDPQTPKGPKAAPAQ